MMNGSDYRSIFWGSCISLRARKLILTLRDPIILLRFHVLSANASRAFTISRLV